MLIISDSPFSLVEYYINDSIREEYNIEKLNKVIANSIEELRETLMTGVSYNKEGELIPSFYLILFRSSSIPTCLEKDKYNTSFIVLENSKQLHKWKKLFNKEEMKHIKDDTKFVTLSPSFYESLIYPLKDILSEEAYSFFWNEYCLNKYHSNPYKWKNQLELISTSYFSSTEYKNSTLYSIDNLKEVLEGQNYRKGISDSKFCSFLFTRQSVEHFYLLQQSQLFPLFIKGKQKSLVEQGILLYYPDCYYLYQMFLESFYTGVVQLREAAYILTFLLSLSPSSPSSLFPLSCKLFKLI